MKMFYKIFCFNILLLGTVYSYAQSRILELSATPFNQNVVINYLISAGNSCAGYQIYRSTDSVNFDLIHDYSGICGETTKTQSVTFKDKKIKKKKKLLQGFNSTCRLLQCCICIL